MSECVHEWYIGADNKGVCRKCGQVRQFPRQRQSRRDYAKPDISFRDSVKGQLMRREPNNSSKES